MRLKLWKMKPIFSFRRRERASSESLLTAALTSGAGRREPVREDLIHDRTCMPPRRARVEREHKVVCTRDFVRMHAESVHPAIAGGASADEPAVADGRVRDGQLRAPPRLAAGILVHDRLGGVRLTVGDEAHPHLLGGTA